MQTKLEERLDTLESDIDELKQMKFELDSNNAYFEQLLQRMEKQIQHHELDKVAKKDLSTVSQGALLDAHGIMGNTKKDQDAHEITEDMQFTQRGVKR